MMATSQSHDSLAQNNSSHQSLNRAFTASSTDNSHRRAKSYDPNDTFGDHNSTDEFNSIPLTTIHYGDSAANPSLPQQYQPPPQQQQRQQFQQPVGAKVGRSLSLFRRPSRHQHGQVYKQGTVPPVPQTPIQQHSGKAASRLLSLEDPILVRIAWYLDLEHLMLFSHLSKRCRAITAKTLTIVLQRTVLKATLCQERKAVFSLEFIFQHLDPASLQAVFRASQLKSRRYFENSALAPPVVQALTLVTPNGSHHPVFHLAGFETAQDGSDSMGERELERATTLLARPFELGIKDKGYYRVSPTTSCMVDTPFFPSQPLLDPLIPIVMEGATHGPPTWEMMYKVDRQLPNYPQRMQEQQQKIYQERARQAALNGSEPPPPPVTSPPVPAPQARANGASTGATAGFVPLPSIKAGPNLRTIIPEPSPLSGSDTKSGSKLQRRPTVVRPPPEGWGPLPPIAPPPAVPASLTYQLGTRTANLGLDISSAIHGGGGGGGGGVGSPMSPTGNAAAGPSCLEPELAEETERFLTLLFIQFPIQTLFPFTAREASKKPVNGGIVSGWMSKSKLGRSLTLKKTHRAGEHSVDHSKQKGNYSPLEH